MWTERTKCGNGGIQTLVIYWIQVFSQVNHWDIYLAHITYQSERQSVTTEH